MGITLQGSPEPSGEPCRVMANTFEIIFQNFQILFIFKIKIF